MIYLTYKKSDMKPERNPFNLGKFMFYVGMSFFYHLGRLGFVALATIVIIYILKAFELV